MKTTIKTILTAVALILTCTLAASAKSDSGMVTKKLDVKSFSEIDASSAINIVYTQKTKEYSATATMTKAADERFEYSCDGKTLKIWLNSKGNNKSASTKVTVRIAAPYLSEVKISGACTFAAKSINQVNKKFDLDCCGASKVTIEKLIADKVELDCCGASNVTITNINCKKAEAEASGASKIVLKGEANEVDFDCSGASNIHAEYLKANKGKAEASGASKITANILNLYEKETSGMSTIRNR